MINCSTYFFECLKNGYYQYPLDSHNEQFKSYQEHFYSDSQIVVHRRPNLMYYTYMRKLSLDGGSACFGVSVVINGLETSSIKSLFRLFERVFQHIVSEGVILTINASGDIVPQVAHFASFAKHFDQLAASIRGYINEGHNSFVPMRPVNYSASNNDFDCISIAEGDAKLKDRLSLFNVLYVVKNDETSSPELNGLAVRIEHLNGQIEYLKGRNQELEKQLSGHKSSNWWKGLSIFLIVIIAVLIIVMLYFISCGILSFNLV